jgi:hypothetical protein
MMTSPDQSPARMLKTSMLSPRRQAASLMLVLFLGLAALAIHASPLSAHSLEASLQESAEQALFDARADTWASVVVEGQVATLSGQAPSRTARQQARTAVARASWAGGAVAGGVTRVIDDTRLAFEGEEVRLAADLVSGRLTLTGFAPDAESADRVRERAERLFPGGSDVTLRIAPGSAPAGWDPAVRLMLAELARLDYGGGRVAEGRIALTGLASNAQTLGTVRAAFDAPPQGYSAAALVRTDGGEFDSVVSDAGLCDLLIEAALGAGAVAFTPGGATLSPGTASVLRRAGRVFDSCQSEPLGVAVRAEGDEPRDEALALERAEAIIAAMSVAGVDPARFLAESAPSDADTAFRLRLRAPAPEPGVPDETTLDPADGEAAPSPTEPAEAREG